MTEVFVEGLGPRPVVNVSCFGRTYREHAAELGNAVPEVPLVFLKSPRAVRGLEPGPLAFADEAFHHEAEVVLLVGREVALSAAAGWDDVCAIGLGLDLTRRAEQGALKQKGLPWTTAKSFAGSAIVAPMRRREEVEGLDAIAFELEVEGALRQRGRTAELTHDVPALLTFLATLTPLGPGDLVFTGTPKGVAELRAGQRFVLSSDQLGRYAGVL